MSEREPPTQTIINIHAPVYGPVAGRDVTLPPSEFVPSQPPEQLMTLADAQQRLYVARAELRRKTFAFYVNWPSALMTLAALTMVAYALKTLFTLGQPHAIDAAPFPVIIAMALTMMGLAWWLDATRRPLRYVLADLRREVHELERAVALGRAGRW